MYFEVSPWVTYDLVDWPIGHPWVTRDVVALGHGSHVGRP